MAKGRARIRCDFFVDVDTDRLKCFDEDELRDFIVDDLSVYDSDFYSNAEVDIIDCELDEKELDESGEEDEAEDPPVVDDDLPF